MTVYVFGNTDVEEDKNAFLAADKLKDKIPGIVFEKIMPGEEVDFKTFPLVIMDAVEGIDRVTLFEDVENFKLPPRVTAHDFDLGFQLKYLFKLGKIKKAVIVGVPMKKKIDYLRIQSILRKLVAQDIHGS